MTLLITVAQAHHQIEHAIHVLADYPKVVTHVKAKDDLLANAEREIAETSVSNDDEFRKMR